MQYVFFGSGPVAVESFRTLKDYFPFDYVVTKSTTVNNISPFISEEKLIVVDNKSDIDDFTTTRVADKSIGILIDFGVIISEQSIDAFSHAIINSHFSLLPNLRGADPITHAILQGYDVTGVSLMKLAPGMDTGDIIAQAIYDLPKNIYVDELTQNLIEISNAMLRECIPAYINGELESVPQNAFSEEVTYANKIEKSDGLLDFEDNIQTIDKKVRALHGWPSVKTSIDSIPVTIERGEIANDTPPLHVGAYAIGKTDDGTRALLMGVNGGVYAITQLKPDGKKSMSAEAFLAGYANKINLV